MSSSASVPVTSGADTKQPAADLKMVGSLASTLPTPHPPKNVGSSGGESSASATNPVGEKGFSTHAKICEIATMIELSVTGGNSDGDGDQIVRYLKAMWAIRAVPHAENAIAGDKWFTQRVCCDPPHIELIKARKELFEAQERRAHAHCISEMTRHVFFGFHSDGKSLENHLLRTAISADADFKLLKAKVSYLAQLVRDAESSATAKDDKNAGPSGSKEDDKNAGSSGSKEGDLLAAELRALKAKMDKVEHNVEQLVMTYVD